MRSIAFGLVRYAGSVTILLCLGLLGSRLAISQTLVGGKDFAQRFTDQGFTEVPSSPFIKVFHKNFNQDQLVVLDRGDLTKPIRLTVFIEGDGAAWRARQLPPRDPSPENPIAANMALTDPNVLVAYMARPCMYLKEEQLKQCSETLWTDARFGKEALALSNQALDTLITKMKSKHLAGSASPLLINLVGYSGGGVIATLLAAQRSDVACLNTIASPLDIEVWTKLQKVAPLSQSFNPAYPDAKLGSTPQMHWFGAEDRVVPPQALGRYHNWSPSLERNQVIQVLPKFNHRDFWVQEWRALRDKSCLN
jgi:hypothetical protein